MCNETAASIVKDGSTSIYFTVFLISDYYFVAWLMLAKTPYTVDSLALESDHDHSIKMIADVQHEVPT